MENVAPPLNMDLASVDTSMPLLADGIQDLLIEKAEIKSTRDGKGQYVSLDLKTTDPATSRKGEPLGAGIHVFDNLNLNPTGAATWDIVLRNVAAFTQALEFSPGQARLENGRINAEEWVPTLPGKIVRAKVGYAPAGTSKEGRAFREKNTIELYLKRQQQ